MIPPTVPRQEKMPHDDDLEVSVIDVGGSPGGRSRSAVAAAVRSAEGDRSRRRIRPVLAMGALLLVPVAIVAGCARPSPPPPAPPPAPTAAPTPTAVPTPPPSSEPPAANRYPGEVLDLSNWYLTLPTGRKSEPDNVYQPALTTYVGPYFHLNQAGDGVVFTANAGGVTTSGSSYPRSELREMSGDQKADWSNITGTHTLSVRQAVMRLPQVKPHVVMAQIHDAEDDVLEVRVEGERLIAEYQDGDGEVVIDPAYRLGTSYDLRIEAAGSRVQVFYNGELKADIPESGSGWYFKAGSYVQSNLDRGDNADAVGEVVIYSLQAAHAR